MVIAQSWRVDNFDIIFPVVSANLIYGFPHVNKLFCEGLRLVDIFVDKDEEFPTLQDLLSLDLHIMTFGRVAMPNVRLPDLIEFVSQLFKDAGKGVWVLTLSPKVKELKGFDKMVACGGLPKAKTVCF